MQQYPGIEIRLISSIWAEQLAADETDIELRLGFGNRPGCHTQVVLRDKVIPICSPKLIDKKQRQIKRISAPTR